MPNTEPEQCVSRKIIHVCVAVIAKEDKILISKRPQHVHQGGLWEFPGGKVEPGENIESAMAREIDEELGIRVKQSRPLIKLLHHYPDKSVLLETRLVTDFDGQSYAGNDIQTGCEGQAVQWVNRQKLTQYSFPAANQAIINALLLPQCYAITPDNFDKDDGRLFEEQKAQFLQRLSLVLQEYGLAQLRIRTLDNDRLALLIEEACHLAQANQSHLLLNSSMPIPRTRIKELHHLSSGIHLTGLHLYDDDWIKDYRDIFPDKLMAASCHNAEDIERANALKLDFVVLSPVQMTASHPGQPGLGWSQFERLTNQATVPVYALGGMSKNDISASQQHGGQGIAAIRDLWNGIIE